jgi:hypothetical protein
MEEKLCFDKVKFLLIMTVATIILSVIFFQNKLDLLINPKLINTQEVKSPDVKCPVCPTAPSVSPTIIVDPIKNYDLRKLDDPLEAPTRRVSQYTIPPHILMNRLNIHTRGYPDGYQQLGLLINTSEEATNNKILRLFGRETFPRSSKYEYYTLIANGLDQIKVPLNVARNKELYDDDEVSISSLPHNYKVQLLPYDSPRYYPDVY